MFIEGDEHREVAPFDDIGNRGAIVGTCHGDEGDIFTEKILCALQLLERIQTRRAPRTGPEENHGLLAFEVVQIERCAVEERHHEVWG